MFLEEQLKTEEEKIRLLYKEKSEDSKEKEKKLVSLYILFNSNLPLLKMPSMRSTVNAEL